MDKKQEIREAILNELAFSYFVASYDEKEYARKSENELYKEWLASEKPYRLFASQELKRLDSLGVVVKVEGELPEIDESYGIPTDHIIGQELMREVMLNAGYTKVERLV